MRILSRVVAELPNKHRLSVSRPRLACMYMHNSSTELLRTKLHSIENVRCALIFLQFTNAVNTLNTMQSSEWQLNSTVVSRGSSTAGSEGFYIYTNTYCILHSYIYSFVGFPSCFVSLRLDKNTVFNNSLIQSTLTDGCVIMINMTSQVPTYLNLQLHAHQLFSLHATYVYVNSSCALHYMHV